VATIFTRSLLFLSSYSPLMIIICVLQYDQWSWWVIALFGGLLGIGSIIFMWLYLWWMRKRSYVYHKKVMNFSKRDGEVMGYIATYLVPFVTFPLEKPKQIIALLLFAVVLMIVYISSNMIYINPVLNIFGFHLYEIEIEHSQSSHYYIAHKPLERNHEISFVRLSDDIYLEK
jgi:hypothetical protein